MAAGWRGWPDRAARPDARARFLVATDVENPLCGPKGAARQFAAQKGADEAMVRRLEAGLRRLARIARRDLGQDCANIPGAGAAGGCGYGLMTFFHAKPENGFQLIRRLTGLDALIRRHDLVITGEGCFDRTSLLGNGAGATRSPGPPAQAPRLGPLRPGHAAQTKTPFARLAAPEHLRKSGHAARIHFLRRARPAAGEAGFRAGAKPFSISLP